MGKVNVSGGGSSFEGKEYKGIGGGGRVSYKKTIDDDSDVEAGVSGHMSKVKVDTPDGKKKFGEKAITGLDLTYSKGDSSYGVDINRTPDAFGNKGTKVNLRYTKRFAKGGVVTANCGASVPPAQKPKK